MALLSIPQLVLSCLITVLVIQLGPNWLKPSSGVPIIKAPAGTFRGAKLTSQNGRGIFAYKSIPYAKPPLGELRLMRPQPLDGPLPLGSKNSKEAFDATKEGNMCSQPITMYASEVAGSKSYLGDEDCLFVNVYVPDTRGGEKELLPVMAWIHGGGFVTGHSRDSFYGPEFLLDRDVIMVSLQYRLGVLGFLDLGNDIVSGNQGLWDQQFALQWIQKNIASFGGDPKRVTIFGESAGSTSVLSHLKAPGSKGLFRAAIAMSGEDGRGKRNMAADKPMSEYHLKAVEEIGCKQADPMEKIRCLQAKDVGDLINITQIFDSDCNLVKDFLPYPRPWQPTSDFKRTDNPFFQDHTGNNSFIDVPTMVGVTRDEGLLVSANPLHNKELADLLAKEWKNCLVTQAFRKVQDEVTEDCYGKLSKLESLYFTEENLISKDVKANFKNLTNFMTDMVFAYEIHNIARKMIKENNSPVYFYRFNHVGDFSLADVFGKSPSESIIMALKDLFGQFESEKLGVSHADDVSYLFSKSVPVFGLKSEVDLNMSDLMVDLWVNFATHLDPTPKKKSGTSKSSSIDKSSAKNWQPAKMLDKIDFSYVVLENGDMTTKRDDESDERIRKLVNSNLL